MHSKFEKKNLRDRMKLKLQSWCISKNSLPMEFEKSKIDAALKSMPEGSVVGAFIPMKDEPSVLSYAQKNSKFRWAFPKIIEQSKSMDFFEVPSKYLIEPELWQQKSTRYEVLLEPNFSVCTLVKSQEIFVALIPGLAFDRAGRRLGRGAGYYDRFLSENPHIKKIGICHSFQVVDELPSEAHDQVMDYLITEEGFQSFI